MNMSELIKCTSLTKRFGSLTALDDINLSIPSGKIVWLLGPNGSGKTTLIKLINGLLTPTSGSVEICGMAPGVETKKLVAYLSDKGSLYTHMTVKQIVTMYADFFEDFRSELAYKMLENLGVDTERPLKTLSKGNQEKVALILVMSRNAKLYVLDEPIAGVDPATRDYIVSTIINNYNPEASVIISTHLIFDIESILDEVIFINKGRIILHGNVEEMKEKNGKSIDEMFREVFKW